MKNYDKSLLKPPKQEMAWQQVPAPQIVSSAICQRLAHGLRSNVHGQKVAAAETMSS